MEAVKHDFDFAEELTNSMNYSIPIIEDAMLEDLHFMAGNSWVKGQGTPAKSPYRYLIAKSREMQKKFGWRVRTLSQMEIVR